MRVLNGTYNTKGKVELPVQAPNVNVKAINEKLHCKEKYHTKISSTECCSIVHVTFLLQMDVKI